MLGMPGNILPLALADFSRAATTNRGVLVHEHVECWADYDPKQCSIVQVICIHCPVPNFLRDELR
jgi:hypothetical protein